MANKKRPSSQRSGQSRPVAEPAKVEETTTAAAETEPAETEPAVEVEETAAEEKPKARKSSKYCAIEGCGRLRLTADNIKTDKCGAHFASRRGG